MPRTAEKVEDFRPLLPKGTRVYIAHIEGTPIEEMIATAKRLRHEGFEPMPHFPRADHQGRGHAQRLGDALPSEADVRQALLLGGGVKTPPHGDFDNSMQLLESGAFTGFSRLHIAGHPEGNRDIDVDGGDKA